MEALAIPSGIAAVEPEPRSGVRQVAVSEGRAQDLPVEDSQLVERVRHGDAAAFDELVNRHMRRAFSVAYRLLGQREDAEDLVQECFIAVLEKIDTFQPGRSFSPWFYRILLNRGLNARKARYVRRTEALPDDVRAARESPLQETERLELRGHLQAAVAGLPERQRTIVEMFEMEGFSSREIAEILDLSDGTVRWHLHQARQTLRAVLAPFAGRTE